MEKTHFCILLFLAFLASLCNSNDYEYDNYKYDEYDYENYDYNNQKPEDYADDYSQALNDYYDQNLLAPPNSPPLPPIPLPTPPPPPMGGQYLLAGCYGTEVVELVKTNPTPSFGQLPFRRYAAVGTMFGNAPLLCGGYNGTSYFDTCISYYQDSGWIQSYSMVQTRAYAAGVKVNSTTFWILGGFGTGTVVWDSTEFIIKGQTNGIPGPKLPYTLWGHCTIKFTENQIFVIGGSAVDSDSKNEVWIYDPQNGFARTQGPSLTKARTNPACSTMKDGEKMVIIIAGGVDFNSKTGLSALDSVEIYDPTDNTWHSGPSLPSGVTGEGRAIAESPDGRGVLLFGGQGNRILELRAGADSWDILNVTMKYDPSGKDVVIPLT